MFVAAGRDHCGAPPSCERGVSGRMVAVELDNAWPTNRRSPGTQSLVDGRSWWWLAVPFVLVIVGGALLPPIDFDVLEYHLQVPREWVQSGRITFLPHNVYGNMPLGAETLAALTMALSPGELGWWWGALGGQAGDGALRTAGGGAAACRWDVGSARREAGILAAMIYCRLPGSCTFRSTV